MTCAAKSIRCVASVEADLGEGPIWDPRIGRLLFVDIEGEKLFAYDPRSEKTETYHVRGKISAIGLRLKGGYVCAHKEGFSFLEINRDGCLLTPVAAPERGLTSNRFNDGKVDPFGGFWSGTMDESEKNPNAGSWWRLAPDGETEKVDCGFHVANGPAFDLSRKRVYFTDSARQTVFAARLTASGFEDKRIFLQFCAGEGYPDGMDVDLDGYVWIAFWDGSAVRRFSPDGELVEEIAVPATRPTSIALVDDRAFVTSARRGLPPEILDRFPASGGLFEISLSRNFGRKESYFQG